MPMRANSAVTCFHFNKNRHAVTCLHFNKNRPIYRNAYARKQR